MGRVVTLASQNQALQVPLGFGFSSSRTSPRAVQLDARRSSFRLDRLAVGIAAAVLTGFAGTASAEVPVNGNRYTIKNKFTSSVIDNPSKGTSGAEIYVKPKYSDGPISQKWRLVYTGILDYWEILSEDGGLCLTHNESTGVTVQSACNGSYSQRFRFHSSNHFPGYYVIENVQSQKYLSTYNCTDSTTAKLGATKSYVSGNGCDEWLFEKTNYPVITNAIHVQPYRSTLDGPYSCADGYHFRKDFWIWVTVDNLSSAGVDAGEFEPDEMKYDSDLYIRYLNFTFNTGTGQVRYYCDVN